MLVWTTGGRTNQKLKTRKQHQAQQLGRRSCSRMGILEGGLPGFGLLGLVRSAWVGFAHVGFFGLLGQVFGRLGFGS